MIQKALAFEKLELLLGKSGKLFRFATLEFATRDTSIYLRIDAPTGKYYYGRATIPAGQTTGTFDFSKQQETTDPKVHLSIHRSGQVHARVGPATSTQPVFTVSLPAFGGQHAATLIVDNLDALRESPGPVGLVNGVLRWPLYALANHDSARVTLYVNGQKPRFDDPCPDVVTLRRGGETVFLGIRSLAQKPLGERGVSGILALGGWPLGAQSMVPVHFVYLRGQ